MHEGDSEGMAASMTVTERAQAIETRIAAACERAGRDRDEVTLIGASKRQSPERVNAVFDAGVGIMGENRVQEALQKIPLCPSGIEWHLIGHLQRNKVRHAVPAFGMVHSVDSSRLLETLDRVCGECGTVMPVCLEINVSGERSKFGFEPEEAREALDLSGSLMNVAVRGLMTMPPMAADPEEARPFFARLRELRDTWRDATGVPLEVLSMGMSHDFEVAVEEGATMVRVGTALFGKRESSAAGNTET